MPRTIRTTLAALAATGTVLLACFGPATAAVSESATRLDPRGDAKVVAEYVPAELQAKAKKFAEAYEYTVGALDGQTFALSVSLRRLAASGAPVQQLILMPYQDGKTKKHRGRIVVDINNAQAWVFQDGDASSDCAESLVTKNAEDNTVNVVLDRTCLGVETARFRPAILVEDSEGGDLAKDRMSRTGVVAVNAD